MKNGQSNIVRFAYVVALVLTGLAIMSSLATTLIIMPLCLIPLFAGLGLRRDQAGSAYGFALYQFSQLIFAVPSFPFVTEQQPGGWKFGSIVTHLVLAGLFVLAGNSLANRGALRRLPLSWILVSTLSILPFVFFQPFSIRTDSMAETLLKGDFILIRRVPRPIPVQGDLIVFAVPPDSSQMLVKRVIGVPGDRIRLVGSAVFRNGAPLRESYVTRNSDYHSLSSDSRLEEYSENQGKADGEFLVPVNKYFVLGDNRDIFLARHNWGSVDFEDVIGKPVLIYNSVGENIEPRNNHALNVDTRTRWRRVFRLLE